MEEPRSRSFLDTFVVGASGNNKSSAVKSCYNKLRHTSNKLWFVKIEFESLVYFK